MTTKRFTILYGLDEDPFDWDILDNEKDAIICQYNGTPICELLNGLHEENEQLKKDVDYWKQVASQYSNELNVFEHCKKYKTECKDIHWSSD